MSVLKTIVGVVLCFGSLWKCSLLEGEEPTASRNSTNALGTVATSSSQSKQESPSASNCQSNGLTLIANANTVIPTLAMVCRSGDKSWVSVPGFCHLLIYYGLGPTDIPSFASGRAILRSLTDEETAVATFGESPFVRTRHGLRYTLFRDPVFSSKVGESHRDGCLATFAELHLSQETPIRLQSGEFSVADLLSESIANFSIEQRELAWTAISYATYIPPKSVWTNRFGERGSFSELAQHLMKLDWSSQSCAGLHVFQALISIEDAARCFTILDPATHRQLSDFIAGRVNEAFKYQRPNGSWGRQWCGIIKETDTGSMSPLEYQILATGHLLQILTTLKGERTPAREPIKRGAEWLLSSLCSTELQLDGNFICPFTHGSLAVRKIVGISGSTNSHLKGSTSVPPTFRSVELRSGDKKTNHNTHKKER